MADKRLKVSELDFEQIKTNLVDYLSDDPEFADYNFEGSALGTITNLLAYVTHYNAVNANLGINETFLDTAQTRGSIVGHARLLGYTPRSASASKAVLNVTVNSPTSQNLTISRGHKFKTSASGTTYNFVTTQDYSTTNATFTGVDVYEGTLKTLEYVYSTSTNERFIIPDADVDTSNLKVDVYDNQSASTFKTFVLAKAITEITTTSRVYFISENPDGRFEVSFGDGVLGKALENGNLISISYLVTNKSDANGASLFTNLDAIETNTNVTVVTSANAAGGADKEADDSIRRNAPITFASQNRCVTPKDFEAVIKENFANIDTIKAWGGEDNDPPDYGKVFVSIKPANSSILSAVERDTILTDIVKPKSVATIRTEIVDPSFTYISLEVFFKYNPSLTTKSRVQLEEAVRTAIAGFSTSTLNTFSGVFRHSNLLKTIDNTDEAILSSTARVYVKKRFIPTLNVATRYELDFSTNLYSSPTEDSVINQSTLFTVNGNTCRLRDVKNADNSRKVQVVKGQGANTEVIVDNAGFVQGTKVVLTAFNPSNFQGNFIEVECIPDSFDIASIRNNLLTIDSADTSIQGEIDSIAAGKEFSGVRYNTVPRHG